MEKMGQKSLDWKSFALLIIDVQNDFWTSDLAQQFPQFPGNITQLFNFCRAEGIEIIHIRAIFMPDMSDWMVRFILRKGIPCVEGTIGAEVTPFAQELPDEKVIIKHTFDGFLTSELLPYLKQAQKRFVLVAGLVTSTCVLFTTASAAQTGFLTAVVEDCCADEPSAHQQTLDRYRFIFDTTNVDLIPDRYPDWLAALNKLSESDFRS